MFLNCFFISLEFFFLCLGFGNWNWILVFKNFEIPIR
jgi:hypothetical protein